MEIGTVAILLSRIVVGAGATFFAILLWSKTRDLAWMFVGYGVMLGYLEILYTALIKFGVIQPNLLVLKGVPILEVVLPNLTFLFITVGFIIAIVQRSPR